MSTLNIGTNVQISGTGQKITGVLGAPGIIPTGAVIYTAGNYDFSGTPRGFVPPGYLPCDGAAYNQSAYPELYDAIRDIFSTGSYGTALINPATGDALVPPAAGQFRVPQLQGQFIRCWDGPVYTSYDPTPSGRIFGSYQADEFRSHSHLTPTTNGIALSPTGREVAGNLNTNFDYVDYYGNSVPVQSTGGLETRPRNIALFAVIKY